MDSKFSEPRGWALKWEGTALLPVAECMREADAVQAEAVPSAGWIHQRRFSEAAMPPHRNDNGRNGLTRPQGWALQWDGGALAAGATGDLPAPLATIERDQESAA